MSSPYTLTISDSVTVTTTAQNLLTLLLAANPNTPHTVRELTLQNDPDQAAGVGNGSFFIGRAVTMTATNCGEKIVFGSSSTTRGTHNFAISLANIWVRSATASVQVNVFGSTT